MEVTEKLPATTIETLTSGGEGSPCWTPLPQQALTSLLGGRLNLTPRPVMVLIKPPSACEILPDSLVLPSLPRAPLVESTGVGPRNHFYDLGWGEGGLPLKQVRVSNMGGGLLRGLEAGQRQLLPPSPSPGPLSQLGCAAPIKPLVQKDLLWRVQQGH